MKNVVEFSSSIPRYELEGAIREAGVKHRGIRSDYPNKKGVSFTLYPFFEVYDPKESLVKMGAVVLLTQQNKPYRLIAPEDVIEQVKIKLQQRNLTTATSLLQP